MDDVTLLVNGAEHKVAAAPDTPLLYVLRNDLKLKGAKFGCGLGLCGACTVMIDGRKALSCDTPLWAAVGKQVTTIEGLAEDGVPHAVQDAFLAEQAAQCGYCTGGMVVAAAALLRENPQPSREEICTAMARNLCRCGAHPRIIRAIERAADALRP
ncbi:(2Fe-2S)-binding protein [Aquabacter sp. CN5-332]|uniref:(2Fe-2S)-binding protein n=1 Tax=Aquabacter sp. CN5-332 TaxID=3156608 RepID=UPI0032B5C8A3